MNQVLFLALVGGLHAALLRLVRCDANLSRAERHAAALTFQFAAWTALSWLLGFLGLFRLEYLLSGAAVILAVVLYGSLFVPPREGAPEPPLADAVKQYFRDINTVAWTVLLIGAILAGSYFWLGWNSPVISWDALSYHLGTAVHLYQDGDFRAYPGESFMTSHFARGVNLLMAISIMLCGTIGCVNTVQWFTLPAMLLSVYTAGRALGMDRSHATIAAALPLTIPVLAYQSTMAYADLATAAWIVVALCAILGAARFNAESRIPSPHSRILWMFAAAGLAVASKFNAVPVAVVLGLAAIAAWGWRRMLLPRRACLGVTIAGFAIAASVGMPWMVRNWVGYGSPVYPIMMTTSAEGLPPWEYPLGIARRISEPDPYYAMPLWQKAWASWTMIDWESWQRYGITGAGIAQATDEELHDGSFGYSGDRLLGGNGLAWLLAGLPALLVTALLSLIPGAGGLSIRTRGYLGVAVAVVIAGFFVTVSPWWARFTIFVPVMGLFFAVYLASWIRQSHPAAATAVLVLVLGTAGVDAATVFFQNRTWEKHRRNEMASGADALTPIHYYHPTPLFPVSPQPGVDHEAIRTLMERARPGETVSFWTPGVGIFTGLFVDARAEVRQFLFPSVWPHPFRYTDEESMRMVYTERIAMILLSGDVPESFVELALLAGGEVVFENARYRIVEFPSNR